MDLNDRISDSNTAGNMADLEKRIAELEITLNNVLREKKLQEDDFAQKRGKFKEIFLQREDELVKEATTVREERDRLEEELLGLKAAASVIESSKQQEIDELKRKNAEEIASFQKVMDEATSVASEETARAYQQERQRLLELNESMALELEELRGHDRKPAEAGNRIFTGFSRTFRNLASPGSSPAPLKDERPTGESKPEQQENLEESMQMAQKHAEMMKSVVVPLEEEVKRLKDNNVKTMEENRLLHSKVEKLQAKVEDYQRTTSETEKVKEMTALLEAEKSNRKDLELFVAVLQKKKDVAEEDSEKFEKDLKNVCNLLEKEKSKFSSLMETWQMANDQFLESQRLQMMDMRRLESVLTEEQQRQVEILQKEDQQREEQEKRVRDLEEKRHLLDQEVEQGLRKELKEESQPIAIPSPDSPSSGSRTPEHEAFQCTVPNVQGTPPDIQPDDLAEFEGAPMSTLVGSSSLNTIAEIDTSDFTEKRSEIDHLGDNLSVSSCYSLTEAQEKAITCATPERVQMDQVLESATSSIDSHQSLAGRRLVSDAEWLKLQEEIRAARERVGKPCDLCSNYEAQLQAVQGKEQEYKDKINSLKLQLEHEQENYIHEQKQRRELEESLKNSAEDAQSQINILVTKNREAEQILSRVHLDYSHFCAAVQDELAKIRKQRDDFSVEVQTLQRENDDLSNKRNIHTSIMNEEGFQLPNDLSVAQSLCLKYREDMITLRANSEHELEMKQAKLHFLEGQLQTEHHTRTALEETYQVELEEKNREILQYKSIKEEYEREKKLRQEFESNLKTTEEVRKNQEIQSEEETVDLKGKLAEINREKMQLEKELQESKKRNAALQSELKNSEAVQMDFVKLSQSLQVQLENIRQGDNEVRWEHEDDVEKCFNCKINFNSHRKKKVHCKHCGKIHCPDCLSKTAESGRSKRKLPVCQVCHTILNKDSAPYYSESPPQNT